MNIFLYRMNGCPPLWLNLRRMILFLPSSLCPKKEREKEIHLKHEYFQGRNNGKGEEAIYHSKHGCYLEYEARNATKIP
jgi:hypothetical protein